MDIDEATSPPSFHILKEAIGVPAPDKWVKREAGWNEGPFDAAHFPDASGRQERRRLMSVVHLQEC